MTYKFYSKTIDTTQRTYYMVEVGTDYKTLENFDFTDKMSNQIEKIIDGVLSTKNGTDEYRWANEDVLLIAHPEAVYFIDLLAQRAGEVKKEQDLTLLHEEFISFLQDFKKFIEEN